MKSLILMLMATAAVLGCRDNTPPPQRVPVPAQDQGERAHVYERDEMKPLAPTPQEQQADIRPPFDDAPILSQRPPEQRAFVDAYRAVGSPRITLFVNRTLEGNIIPGNPDDYRAIETIMTDWMAANGQVMIISPTVARQHLTDQQVKELQAGRSTGLSEVARQLDADVLIQVQVQPMKQMSDGSEVRIIAEAMNTKGGQSIGRAVVDVPPPLEKTTINRSTRFLARKLMDDMIQTWSATPPPPERTSVAPARSAEAVPTTVPTTQP